MENHEAPTPSKELLDKWQQEAYRDYGCADAAYASVIENAAKWGYSQAMKQMYQKLQNLLDSWNDWNSDKHLQVIRQRDGQSP